MKLIELVTKSLEIIGGGWPENVVAMSQGYDMGIRAYVYHDNIMQVRQDYLTKVSCLAIDFDTALVTREQYEAALAASQKVEWDGVGLPPVGIEVESAQPGQINWTEFKVIAVDSGAVFGFWSNGVASALDGDRWLFRPIRSETDKKRDEAIESIASYALPYKCGADIYDAIAAGKIPGVRIE